MAPSTRQQRQEYLNRYLKIDHMMHMISEIRGAKLAHEMGIECDIKCPTPEEMANFERIYDKWYPVYLKMQEVIENPIIISDDRFREGGA